MCLAFTLPDSKGNYKETTRKKIKLKKKEETTFKWD
jgi:hypothetical protein